MRHASRLGLLTLALVALAVDARAQPLPPDVTPAEFKCMSVTSRAIKKFVAKTFKCVNKCLGSHPLSDPECMPPYASATLTCVGIERGAAANLRNAILKRCDVATGGDCPECYSGGDCSAMGEAEARPVSIGAQLDVMIPGVVCERAGATIGERDCQVRTIKTLGKFATQVYKCSERCVKDALQGEHAFSECTNPFSPTMDACLTRYRERASDTIDNWCGADSPNGAECPVPYPDGTDWTALTQIAFVGLYAEPTYCAQ